MDLYWWLTLGLLAPLLGFILWSGYHEAKDRRRCLRALDHLVVEEREARRIASTICRPERQEPLDVRSALRRDQRSK